MTAPDPETMILSIADKDLKLSSWTAYDDLMNTLLQLLFDFSFVYEDPDIHKKLISLELPQKVSLHISVAHQSNLDSDIKDPVHYCLILKLPSHKYIPHSDTRTDTGLLTQSFDIHVVYPRLQAILGPVLYQNEELTDCIPDNGLELSTEMPCIIEIINYEEQKIISGLGCYYGNGHILTAFHVVKNQYDSEIYVCFPMAAGMLVYKAVFTQFCNTYPDRDQAFVKLCGNTSPLGDGLQNYISDKVSDQGRIYFYTLADSGHFQKHEKCKIITPNNNMKAQMHENEFVISEAGRRGDSGAPVFCNGKMVAIYFGCFESEKQVYGRCSKPDPRVTPWPSSN